VVVRVAEEPSTKAMSDSKRSCPRIGLITCMDNLNHLSRHGTQKQLFTKFLKLSEEPKEIFEWKAHESKLPDLKELKKMDVYIIAGSPASAYDNDPWVKSLIEFVKYCHQQRQPLIGICFGHQIMSYALGGNVKKSGKGWGIGFHVYDYNKGVNIPKWVMYDMRKYVNAYASHQDQVMTVPEGATVMAGNSHCKNGFIIYNDIWWSIQTHPEFHYLFARDIYNGRKGNFKASLYKKAVAECENPHEDRRKALAKSVMNFSKLMKESRNMMAKKDAMEEVKGKQGGEKEEKALQGSCWRMDGCILS